MLWQSLNCKIYKGNLFFWAWTVLQCDSENKWSLNRLNYVPQVPQARDSLKVNKRDCIPTVKILRTSCWYWLVASLAQSTSQLPQCFGDVMVFLTTDRLYFFASWAVGFLSLSLRVLTFYVCMYICMCICICVWSCILHCIFLNASSSCNCP